MNTGTDLRWSRRCCEVSHGAQPENRIALSRSE